jgi:hypothetical protein
MNAKSDLDALAVIQADEITDAILTRQAGLDTVVSSLYLVGQLLVSSGWLIQEFHGQI